MMSLSCKDINPATTCTYTATGESAADVASKMLTHAKMDHADDIAAMNMSDDEVVKKFESMVHN